ncbi:MAG: DUF2378 family protein [candidate division FCPU426 bacterium]
MANIKGTDIVALRKILAGAGPGTEQKLLDRLSPEQRRLYENAVSTTLSPVPLQTDLYVRAAELLYPNDPNRMVRLGQDMANRSYSTVYKLFLRIPTMEFVISRAASVWRSYFDAGEAEARNLGGKHTSFVVRHFPSLPRKMREVIAGNIQAIMGMAGAKNVQIQTCDDDPEAWEWKLSWE